MSETNNLEESNVIDLDFYIEHLHNVSIITITTFDLYQLDDSLPLVYLELIDWVQKEPLDIGTFPNDDAIAHYLCSVNPEISSTMNSMTKLTMRQVPSL